MTTRTPGAAIGKPRRPPRAPVQTVNIDFPLDLLARIDRVVARLGVPRQAWIKMRLTDWLDREAPLRPPRT